MIIICEPQSIGFVHAEVNSALLSVVSKAYPGEKILFMAEKDQLKFVKDRLSEECVGGIDYRPIKVPKQNFRNYKRFFQDLMMCKNVFDIAQANKAHKVIFSSTTSSFLVSIKVLIHMYRDIECLVVLHNVLETILKPPSMMPLEAPFWFRIVLPHFNSNRVRYLVLGQSIKDQLRVEMPRMDRYVDAMDHPYFFIAVQGRNGLPKDGISFGSFGVGAIGKGTDLLVKLAGDVRDETGEDQRFILIGHIVDKSIRDLVSESDCPVYVPSPDKPLSREAFDSLAKSVDYAVFPYRPDTYRLTASGTLFDAISYVKPVIAIKNPFFEYYFKELGDIGYLCDSYDEMKDDIIDIIKNRPYDRYLDQCKNLLEARKRLEHFTLGKKLNENWEKGFGKK